MADCGRVASIPLLPTLTSIGDPDGARTMTSIIVLLVAIGLALILLAVWIFRATRPDPDLLAPLEVMGERSWRRKDPVWQRRRLDELRPPGAKPLVPSAAPPELDESFEAGPSASGFDDLQVAGPLLVPEGGIPTGRTGADRAAADRAADDRSGADEPVAGGRSADDAGPDPVAPSDSTPTALIGPTLDELPDGEFDPDSIAAARADLERELDEASRRSEQLGLFEHDEHR